MRVTLPTLVTFGSRRHSDGIAMEAAKHGGRVFHLDEEVEHRGGLKRDAASLFAEASKVIQDEIKDGPIALLSLGRATVPGGIKEIACCCEQLIARFHGIMEIQYIGPSAAAAQIFEDKVQILKALTERGIPTPATTIVTLETEESSLLRWMASHKAPFVCKAPCFSGGRGITLASNEGEVFEAINALRLLGVREVLVSEFVTGLEVSSAIFMYKGKSTRFPPCWKAPTELSLRHPDSKVKLVGIGPNTDRLHQMVETLAHDLAIEGFFYLEAITPALECETFFVIEGATRISGNSVIESAIAPFYDLYRFIISVLGGDFPTEHNSLQHQGIAIQHASFSKIRVNTLPKTAWLPALVEVRNEELGLLPASCDDRLRQRISFKGASMIDAIESARSIGEALGDPLFASEILATMEKCCIGPIPS